MKEIKKHIKKRLDYLENHLEMIQSLLLKYHLETPTKNNDGIIKIVEKDKERVIALMTELNQIRDIINKNKN